jgi:hypothetical protein
MLTKVSWGKGFVKNALKASVVCFAFTGAATIAEANPVSFTNANIAVYQFTCASCGIGSAAEQAVNTNTSISLANLKGTGTYTGAINFIQPGDTSQNGSMATFLASAGGSNTLSAGVLALQLSSSPFALTTIFVLSGTTSSVTSGFVTHDDGATLYNSADTAVTPAGSGTPTAQEASSYTLPAGAWQLVYVEANGLPAQLTWDSVTNFDQTTPLPAALPLFATGLGVLGLFGVRRKRKIATA